MRPFWVLVWFLFSDGPHIHLPVKISCFWLWEFLTLVMSGIRLPSCGLMSGICHGPIINLHYVQPVGLAVDWCHLLWLKGHIRRYSCILWPAIEGRISTQDRLRDMGIIKVCALSRWKWGCWPPFFRVSIFEVYLNTGGR